MYSALYFSTLTSTGRKMSPFSSTYMVSPSTLHQITCEIFAIIALVEVWRGQVVSPVSFWQLLGR